MKGFPPHYQALFFCCFGVYPHVCALAGLESLGYGAELQLRQQSVAEIAASREEEPRSLCWVLPGS